MPSPEDFTIPVSGNTEKKNKHGLRPPLLRGIHEMSVKTYMQTTLTIQPCIFNDENLNTASQRQAALKTIVYGKNKKELLKAIREKIWAMGGAEATIGDEQVAKEYNEWITQLYHQRKTPEKIENLVSAQMLYALPYSEDFKRSLRGKA